MTKTSIALLVLTLIAPESLQAQGGDSLRIVRADARAWRPTSHENMSGQVRSQFLFDSTATTRAYGTLVAFEPGARTGWHTHGRAQVLMVTAGTGRVQLWGRPAEELRVGDVVTIPAGVKHWHGASPTTAMTHLVVIERSGAGTTTWLEQVSDAQYGAGPVTPTPLVVGNALGLPVLPAPDGRFEPMSPNVKVYGSIYSAESCSYDATRDVIVVPNRGVPQQVEGNNAWVSFINHDGSVHTARWIGVQGAAERAGLTPPLVLNEPYGSDIANGMLYVADRDGGTSTGEPSVAVIRRFDMRSGMPRGATRVEGVAWLNDIAVAPDGTVYATQTGDLGDSPNPATWQLWKITPQGQASVVVSGKPLFQPNGVALDPHGNVVVVNIGNADVMTFSPAGALLKTEQAAQTGNDGLVIMPDGTKYVSSVRLGGVSRIRPGQPAELIARNIPSAASMCYDAGANQLVIPMNPNNGLAFVKLGGERQR